MPQQRLSLDKIAHQSLALGIIDNRDFDATRAQIGLGAAKRSILTDNDRRYAIQQNCATAHIAGRQRRVQRRTAIFRRCEATRIFQAIHFRMQDGAASLRALIVAAADDLAINNQHRSNRNAASLPTFAGLCNRSHKKLIHVPKCEYSQYPLQQRGSEPAKVCEHRVSQPPAEPVSIRAMLGLRCIAKWLFAGSVVLLLTVYFVRAFDARSMPPLGPEHRIPFAREFDASQEDKTDWTAYLAIENELAIELEAKIPSETRTDSPPDRYFANSLTYPANFPSNWNRSYEVSVPTPRGVAVLLHGLTDSPYSLLATAETMAGAGYNVVVPRMPGHGFAVGGLVQARWEDWTAAVRIAVRRAMELPGADQSLLLVGYSNGGLLAVDYALQCDEIAAMPCPDGLVLLSPGIAISPAAAVINWHAALSWIPYFEQFGWLSILPEIDPFKFTSFPKRPAWEMHKISKRVHDRLTEPNAATQLPPILTFQSIVDNTVSAAAIVTTLYDRLQNNGSELVVYDVNRNNTMLHLMKTWPEEPLDYFLSLAPLNFGVTLVKNQDASSNTVVALTLEAGHMEPATHTTGLRWPTQFYSLSHIAIPFRADDMLYGDGSLATGSNDGPNFGALAPRGERGVLLLTSDYFLRSRYNPFFTFQARKLTEWLNQLSR